SFALSAEHMQQPSKLSESQQQLAQNQQQTSGSQAPQPQPGQAPLVVPSDDVLLVLIRASIIALNQANVTGNYTVLRDLAAPSFKEANSADKLAKAFVNIRKLDLSRTLLIQPKLYRNAEITPKGRLRITGLFPLEPGRLDFDLVFEAVQGRWRLFGI